jgi:tetratricopeptide (TPR) repeat protein
MGKIEEAIKSYKKAIGLFPGFLDANYNLGLALARQKDTEGALKAFERVVELAPESDKARSAREYMDLIK